MSQEQLQTDKPTPREWYGIMRYGDDRRSKLFRNKISAENEIEAWAAQPDRWKVIRLIEYSALEDARKEISKLRMLCALTGESQERDAMKEQIAGQEFKENLTAEIVLLKSQLAEVSAKLTEDLDENHRLENAERASRAVMDLALRAIEAGNLDDAATVLRLALKTFGSLQE